MLSQPIVPKMLSMTFDYAHLGEPLAYLDTKGRAVNDFKMTFEVRCVLTAALLLQALYSEWGMLYVNSLPMISRKRLMISSTRTTPCLKASPNLSVAMNVGKLAARAAQDRCISVRVLPSTCVVLHGREPFSAVPPSHHQATYMSWPSACAKANPKPMCKRLRLNVARDEHVSVARSAKRSNSQQRGKPIYAHADAYMHNDDDSLTGCRVKPAVGDREVYEH
eukprot:6173997-Pleurochrysis_carterae.AAC.1